ncbi:MAG: hypothetical protein WCE54_20085, partial [Ignavibacteriaceae bacterium]
HQLNAGLNFGHFSLKSNYAEASLRKTFCALLYVCFNLTSCFILPNNIFRIVLVNSELLSIALYYNIVFIKI